MVENDAIVSAIRPSVPPTKGGIESSHMEPRISGAVVGSFVCRSIPCKSRDCLCATVGTNHALIGI